MQKLQKGKLQEGVNHTTCAEKSKQMLKTQTIMLSWYGMVCLQSLVLQMD